MWSEDKAVVGRLLVQRTPKDRSDPTTTRLRIGRLLRSATRDRLAYRHRLC